MKNFNKVELEFKEVGTIRGGILFLPLDKAIKIVNRAEQEGIGILGIDAFYLKSDKTQPSMDDSKEFKFEDNTDYDEVRTFLKNKSENKELWFEVVFDEKE
ncbi:MAG: hypothetical protein AB7S78_03270 [Candidatus Omnitrophota bacterium]